ncbi:MAG: hypothetical protein ACRDWG_18740 [Actinomycetes bacterium]
MRIRTYSTHDRDAVFALAPRLTVGVARWRDPHKVVAAVARDFYAALGYDEEDIRLTRSLAT